MSSAWKSITLGEAITLQRGFDLPEYQRKPGRVPVVTSSGISGYHSEAKVKAPGVVIGRYGTIGLVHYVTKDFWPHNTSLYVKDFKGNHPRYISYLLQIVNYEAHSDKSSVPGVNRNDLHSATINLPPLPEQRSIARILGTLDDKIELNRRMNHTLEEMARALFKSWFVDFDPVTAKAEGRGPFGMNAEMASLFPAEFEETENEDFPEIPKGWKLGTFGDIAENIRRGVSPKAIDPEMPYIGLEHMPRKSIELSEWGRAGDVTSNKFVFKKGEILFGKLRPYFHKVGVAPLDGVCSTDVLVVSPKSPEHFGLILGHVSTVDFVNFVDAASEGTKMPRTNWETMARFTIAIPDEKLSEAFTQKIMPMIKKIHANIFESHSQVSIRDALLPKLLSGELRVKQAEKAIEDM